MLCWRTLLLALMFVVFVVLMYHKTVTRHMGPVAWDAATKLVIVSAHYNEDMDWLMDSKHPVVVCDKPGADRMPFSPDPRCTLAVNRGKEASSFLKFIIEYYDELPEFVAFLHGHEHAWHHRLPFSLLEALDRAKTSDFQFINLNNVQHSKFITQQVADASAKDRAPDVEVAQVGHRFLQEHWQHIFEPLLGIPFPAHLRYMCCAQFMVSRRAIRARPRATYQTLYDMLMDPGYGDDLTLAYAMESMWHVIFGEPPDMCASSSPGRSTDSCTERQYADTRFS